jgi:hypothetical protein
MDERTDWARSRSHEHPHGPPREPPPGFNGWNSEGGDRSQPPRAGTPGGPRIPDLSALLAVVDALRRVVPRELQEQFTALQRELLLTLRALIDWYLDRLDKPELEPQVEDIPIE